MKTKYTDDELLADAKKYGNRQEWQLKSRKMYDAAWYRGLLPQIYEFLPPSPGPQSAYTDEELLADALKYPNRQEWKKAGLQLRLEGKPSHYVVATKRGKEFFQRCCAHMPNLKGTTGHKVKYTDDELIQTAQKFKHKCDWRKAEYNMWQAAMDRPEVWKQATAHMTPACNPYAGDYIVYAFEFADHHVYVGITFNEDNRMAGHACRGPVFEHKKICPQAELKRVQINIMSPADAAEAEKMWVEHYKTEGWTLLNVALPGGLGGLMPRWTKDAVIWSAQQFQTRKAWLLGEQYAYKAAKRLGVFEDAVEHMPTSCDSQRGRRGKEKRSLSARQRMSASALRRHSIVKPCSTTS